MPIRKQTGARWTLAIMLACAVSLSRSAHACAALLTPDCGASGGGISCYLPGILRVLYILAVLLGVVLLVVIALAVKSFRKPKDDEKVGS